MGPFGQVRGRGALDRCRTRPSPPGIHSQDPSEGTRWLIPNSRPRQGERRESATGIARPVVRQTTVSRDVGATIWWPNLRSRFHIASRTAARARLHRSVRSYGPLAERLLSDGRGWFRTSDLSRVKRDAHADYLGRKSLQNPLHDDLRSRAVGELGYRRIPADYAGFRHWDRLTA